MKAIVLAGGTALIALALAGCGQRGNLFLPRDTEAADRATLPQALRPTPFLTTPTLPAPPAEAPNEPPATPAEPPAPAASAPAAQP